MRLTTPIPSPTVPRLLPASTATPFIATLVAPLPLGEVLIPTERAQDIGMELALSGLTALPVASALPNQPIPTVVTAAPLQVPSPLPTIPQLQTTPATALPNSVPTPGELSGQIVYVCSDPQDDELCLMNADGSQQRTLTNNTLADYYPSLAPDGSYIVFARQEQPGSEDFYEIYRIQTDGTGEQKLTNNQSKNAAPAVSPDGQQIVFTSKLAYDTHQVWLMNADGTSARQLTFDGASWDPTWSPDGTYIAFASNRSGSNQLYKMKADGTQQERLTDVQGLGGRSSWSADAAAIVFYAGDRTAKTRQIYRLDLATGSLLAITTDGISAGPCYSPFGRWVTFQTGGEVVIMRDDGSDLRVLTSNVNMDYQPRWGK